MARAGEKTDGKAAENFWRVWRQAQAGQVCPVCLLFGQEFYLQEKLLERMRRVWLGETVSELNYSREDGGRLTAGQTADLANQMPFFTVRRLILVDEPGFIPCAARGGKKDDADEAGREDGAADDGEGRSEGEDKAGGQAAAAGGRGARG
ncbi:MAG: hypothetical protein LBK98_01510, partial [Peptococcaceae bacterium]|nr:hypothetical protein [Peptococcaceae bacterium]